MLFRVLKIFASNIFSFSDSFGKTDKKLKSLLKTILFAIVFLYAFFVYAAMYIFTMISTYKNLQITSQTELMPVISLIIASVMVFVFGFLSVSNNYYTGNGEEQFLSMPLKPFEFFGAKIGVSFITDALLGMFILLVGGVIYGYNEGLLLRPSFYIGLIVSTFTVSITIIFIIYLLLILVLSLIPILRKKSILNGIAVFFIVVFALFYSVFTSRVDFDVQSSQNLQNSILLANVADKLIDKLPWVEWISGALIGDWLSILFMTLLFCLVVFALIPLTAPVYIRTLNGFMDVRTKKLTESQVKGILKREVKAASITRALFFRDVKTVFREPAFFSKGPLALVLLPAIFVISFIAGFHGRGGAEIENLKFNIDVFFLSADFAAIEKVKYYIVLGAAAVTIFLANSANVASTSFSREGKSFYCLKAMPIKNDTIVFVKFLHAFLYTIVAFVIVALPLVLAEQYLGLPFSILENLYMLFAIFVIEIVVSLLLIFIDMFMDTVHPKLDWENPIAAFKRNFNTFLSIIITVGVVALFLLLGIVVIPKNSFGLIIITLVFLAIAAPLGSCYWKYAIKKIDRL